MVGDSELKVVYGWSMSSRMPQTYIHLSTKEVDPKLEVGAIMQEDLACRSSYSRYKRWG